MNYRIEIKWGVIFIIMMLLWTFLEKSVGLHSRYISLHQVYSNLVIIPSVIIFILALLDKKKNFYNGSMTYKEGFVTGFYITIIIAILSPISQFIATEIISPDYFNNVIRFSVKQGTMSQQEAIKYYSLFNYMIFSLIGALILGTIISAIVAAFVKTKKRHRR
ncbi:MAG TPA: DUF4199 domain-containing protein [Ignavibacteria bacterium]|nr:DUF4199 domain-containing protein [Ignavibacteria bacterium]HMR39340.1 DUF4199 domain-containing protein [Ignavibacteria bacterium]